MVRNALLILHMSTTTTQGLGFYAAVTVTLSFVCIWAENNSVIRHTERNFLGNHRMNYRHTLQRRQCFTSKGIWSPTFFSVDTNGRATAPCFFWINAGSTVSPNSKERIRTKSKAFILSMQVSATRTLSETDTYNSYSTIVKRYPMHARVPPMKVIRCPQMPGISSLAGGMFSQRSGLWLVI